MSETVNNDTRIRTLSFGNRGSRTLHGCRLDQVVVASLFLEKLGEVVFAI